MKLALENNELVSHLVAVDIAPVTYPAFSVFSDYIEYMRAIDLSRIKSRKEADEFLIDKIPVIFFSLYFAYLQGLGNETIFVDKFSSCSSHARAI
jgi:hypothetical protein